MTQPPSKEKAMGAILEDAVTSTRVTLREVGLREGLQSHPDPLPTAAKVELFHGLRDAGFAELNVVAFVSPAKMPQMADAEDLLRSLGPLRDGATLSGLVPNERGLERAIAMREEGLLDTILLVFGLKSQGLEANGMTSSPEALLRQIERHAATAQDAGLNVTVFLSGAFGCSIEGWVNPEQVVAAAARIHAMPGVTELVVSDSTGQADPLQVGWLLRDLAEVLPVHERLGIHFHDTRGAGLANVVAALASPFEHLVLDGAFGGWGGDFPFVPEAFGNVATEDLAEMLAGMGIAHGIDVERVIAVTSRYHELTGRPPGAKLRGGVGPVAWKRERRAAWRAELGSGTCAR